MTKAQLRARNATYQRTFYRRHPERVKAWVARWRQKWWTRAVAKATLGACRMKTYETKTRIHPYRIAGDNHYYRTAGDNALARAG